MEAILLQLTAAHLIWTAQKVTNKSRYETQSKPRSH